MQNSSTSERAQQHPGPGENGGDDCGGVYQRPELQRHHDARQRGGGEAPDIMRAAPGGRRKGDAAALNILLTVTLAVALFDLVMFGVCVWMGYQKAKDNEKDR